MDEKKWSLNDAEEELDSPSGIGPFTLTITTKVRIELTPNHGSGIGVHLTIPSNGDELTRAIIADCYGLDLEEIAAALGIDMDARIWK